MTESISPKRFGVHLCVKAVLLSIFTVIAVLLMISKTGQAPCLTQNMQDLDEQYSEMFVTQDIENVDNLLDEVIREEMLKNLKELSNDKRDYRGYRRLAGQIGEEKANLAAKLIEYSAYPDLIRAIITIESSWKVNALSKMDAIGLMQVRLITAREVDPNITRERLFDPIHNIVIGIEIFENHMDYFNEYENGELWALTSYNRGRYGTFALHKSPQSTRYSRKVLELSENM